MSHTTHFIGIGGTGLSAIARVLLERGETVTGSDRESSPLADALSRAGAHISIGHAPNHVNGATRVIRSSAVTDENVEVRAALEKGIPVYKRSEILGDLLAGQKVLAVAGSHGKTTTTAMLAWMLHEMGRAPGYIIGSVASNLGGNAAAGAGDLFVIEADEYDRMFLGLCPSIALVTNVEHDHPDLFPTAEEFTAAFRQFTDRLRPEGSLIVCADDSGALSLKDYAASKGRRTCTYALHTDADYRAVNLAQLPNGGFAFDARRGDQHLARVALAIPGEHNAQNALGALAVINALGLPADEAAAALIDFRGTKRRFSAREECAGILIVDDYAHHPTEIRAALAAGRARYPGRRLWALWQPHTFSRTQTLWDGFANAFGDADQVLVTGVYAAREQPPAGFDMGVLAAQIHHDHVRYAATLPDARELLLNELQPGDLLFVLSAGDAIELSAQLHQELAAKE